MDKKLMFKLLALLEETYPESYSLSGLAEELSISFIDGNLKSILVYLIKSKKITRSRNSPVIHIPDDAVNLQSDDLLHITNQGLDFLREQRINKKLEKQNKYLFIASIITAIATATYAILEIIKFFSK